MITIYFTRHSTSCRNLYDSLGQPALNGVNSVTFRDTPLCPDGIERIIRKRDEKRRKIGEIDATITSPLKRCIETTLMTYQNVHNRAIKPIYVMSLVMEYSAGHDSLGNSMSQICTDPTIFSYRHFPSLDFNYFMEGFQSQHFTGVNQFRPYTLEWAILDYRMNPQRSEWFFDFVRTHFQGKRIHVVTHSMFIYSIIGVIIDNYETVKVDFNTETGEIKWNKI